MNTLIFFLKIFVYLCILILFFNIWVRKSLLTLLNLWLKIFHLYTEFLFCKTVTSIWNQINWLFCILLNIPMVLSLVKGYIYKSIIFKKKWGALVEIRENVHYSGLRAFNNTKFNVNSGANAILIIFHYNGLWASK